jgi:hypothetical protein
VDAPVVSGDCVYTISGLATGTPVYVRVAARVTIVFGTENIALPPGAIGPYYTVPDAVTPLLPTLARVVVQGGAQMSTTGLQTAILVGSNLGLSEAGTAMATASYASADFEHTATGCFVAVDSVEVRCTTVEGVGAGYVWSLVVDGGVAVSPSASAVTLSYQAPILLLFSGAGASGATTNGGQVRSVMLTCKMRALVFIVLC